MNNGGEEKLINLQRDYVRPPKRFPLDLRRLEEARYKSFLKCYKRTKNSSLLQIKVVLKFIFADGGLNHCLLNAHITVKIIHFTVIKA